MNDSRIPVVYESDLRMALFLQYDVEFNLREMFNLVPMYKDVGNIIYLNQDSVEDMYYYDSAPVRCVITFLQDVYADYDYVIVLSD